MPKKPKNVKLESAGDTYAEGDKRTYFPYKLECDCPACGSRVEMDFNDQYISYPNFGKKEMVGLYCDKCEEEFVVAVYPDITLSLSLKKPEKK